MNKNKTIDDVRCFWDNNPLFAGESKYEPGTFEFFEEHKNTYYSDCFAGKFDDNILFPNNLTESKVLDLGCGVGFWTIEIQKKRDTKEFHSADISSNAIDITKKRLEIYNLNSILSLENAESLSYPDSYFDHVNCQGVIHHTPDTDAAISEIARVLNKGGTAYISVYYKNIILKNWTFLSFFGKLLTKWGGGLKGRGRDNIFNVKDTDDITRLYDGDSNPIGKSYTKKQIFKMLEPHFIIEDSFLFFFPARALPFKMPKKMQRFLAKYFGFMIFIKLRKK